MRKNCSSDIEKLLKFEAEITRTIYSNSERSEQFLVKFIFSKKATKIDKMFIVDLTFTT